MSVHLKLFKQTPFRCYSLPPFHFYILTFSNIFQLVTQIHRDYHIKSVSDDYNCFRVQQDVIWIIFCLFPLKIIKDTNDNIQIKVNEGQIKTKCILNYKLFKPQILHDHCCNGILSILWFYCWTIHIIKQVRKEGTGFKIIWLIHYERTSINNCWIKTSSVWTFIFWALSQRQLLSAHCCHLIAVLKSKEDAIFQRRVWMRLKPDCLNVIHSR